MFGIARRVHIHIHPQDPIHLRIRLKHLVWHFIAHALVFRISDYPDNRDVGLCPRVASNSNTATDCIRRLEVVLRKFLVHDADLRRAALVPCVKISSCQYGHV